MPRTRKHYRWTVHIGNDKVEGIRSKTYEGACYKAFKKLNVTPTEYNSFYKIFSGVTCVKQ